MRLDHLSYACTTSEIADVVQRIGSDLGGTFVDGGRHPSFGTRNFILPLAGGCYVEV
ncbi:MAG: VOC family protein, partial [Actinomycetota bacterium]